jgi:hypothetical protein
MRRQSKQPYLPLPQASIQLGIGITHLPMLRLTRSEVCGCRPGNDEPTSLAPDYLRFVAELKERVRAARPQPREL